MKLFVVAALVAVSSAARLEHLEQQQQLRKYLPPDQNSGFGSYQRFGSNGAHGSLGANSGSFGASGAGQSNFNAVSAFPGVKNAYLPPNFESSAASSGNEFGAQNVAGQQYGNQPAVNPFGYRGAAQGNKVFGAQTRFQSQPSAVNRQYLAPHSSQNIPQQPFDEKTGYLY
ncbi:unnamed protein product [Arctia plantaginis]|uniref:Uncharacterized protein n=1 Tax=Arctia plantaginis TaxID=874455 RepID=A0A8S0Z806_ARCPL|nr:unnamed protein product [Arctia plantaginis]